MKTIFKSIILLLPVILLVSCFGGKSDSPDNEMSYHGVSFKYPSYWESETTKELGDGGYFIKCKEKFDRGTMLLVSFFDQERDPENILEAYLENIQEGNNLTIEPIEKSKFGNYDCMSVYYKFSILRVKSYGIASVFNASGKTILVVEQSERDYNLKHDKYKLIRNSFYVDEPVMEDQIGSDNNSDEIE